MHRNMAMELYVWHKKNLLTILENMIPSTLLNDRNAIKLYNKTFIIASLNPLIVVLTLVSLYG